MTRGEVVGAVEDHIALRHLLLEGVAFQAGGKGEDLDFGIEVQERVASGVDLARANVVRVVQDLPLQVRKIDLVRIGEGEPSEAACREIQRSGAAEAAGADDQRASRAQPRLSFDPDLGKKDVAAVAEELLVVQ
jgi:hypothetical protein